MAQALQVGQREASSCDVQELDDVLRAPLEPVREEVLDVSASNSTSWSL
jgi:hypothetical protein